MGESPISRGGRGEEGGPRGKGGGRGETYVTVGEPHDEPVLGGIVLVLGLGDEALTGVVVSLSLASATVLCLKAGVVGVGLDDFGERL